MNGGLPKNIIKSHGMRCKGVKVKGGRRRWMMGEKSTPKELGIANQCGTKRFALRSNKIMLPISKKMEIR